MWRVFPRLAASRENHSFIVALHLKLSFGHQSSLSSGSAASFGAVQGATSAHRATPNPSLKSVTQGCFVAPECSVERARRHNFGGICTRTPGVTFLVSPALTHQERTRGMGWT